MKSLPLLLSAVTSSLLFVITLAQPAPTQVGKKTHFDLAYVTNGHARQKLDLYLPEKADGPAPLIIWIHGGGWSSGDKQSNGSATYTRYIQRGYAVASLNYRLSGEAIFPAQIEDCKAAIRWLRAHANDYNLDAAHFGVWGSSAGGHLVALLGATGDRKDFDVGENLNQSSAVQAVCDYYGPTDLLQMDAHAIPNSRFTHNAPNAPEARLVGGPIQEKPYRDLARRVNPIPYLTKNAPPYLIVHGDADPTVPHHQSELLYAALQKIGVPVRFHTIKGAGHGVGFAGKEISEMVTAFFDHHLMKKETAAEWPVAMKTTSNAAGGPKAGSKDQPITRNQPNTPTVPGSRPTWAQIIAREDANHDGKIARDEFKGQPQLFERLDRNDDNVITQEEFESAGRS